MAIHYTGPISNTPGAVPCPVLSPQALTSRWVATDCNTCKLRGLMGLGIIHADPGSIPGTIVNVSSLNVGARFTDPSEGVEEQPTVITFASLDSGAWKVGVQE